MEAVAFALVCLILLLVLDPPMTEEEEQDLMRWLEREYPQEYEELKRDVESARQRL